MTWSVQGAVLHAGVCSRDGIAREILARAVGGGTGPVDARQAFAFGWRVARQASCQACRAGRAGRDGRVRALRLAPAGSRCAARGLALVLQRRPPASRARAQPTSLRPPVLAWSHHARRCADRWRERMRHRLAWPRDPALAVDAAGSGPVKLAIASGAMAREAGGPSSGDGAALPRILRTYVAARAALGLALVLAPGMASLMGGRTPLFVTSLCLAYAGQAVSLWLLRWPAQQRVGADQLRPRQWLWTIGVDLLAFSLLRLLDPQAQLNHAALLVLPLLRILHFASLISTLQLQLMER